jgi:hypothetical protein
LSSGSASDAYDSLISEPLATRSKASRREMSSACRDTRRSRGDVQSRAAPGFRVPDAHCCALAATAGSARRAAMMEAAASERAPLPTLERAKLRASSRRRCPVENRDVPLTVDARAERKGNDIENAVNRLTGKRCGQVQIRERGIRHP